MQCNSEMFGNISCMGSSVNGDGDQYSAIFVAPISQWPVSLWHVRESSGLGEWRMKAVTFQEQVHISVDVDGLYMDTSFNKRCIFWTPKDFSFPLSLVFHSVFIRHLCGHRSFRKNVCKNVKTGSTDPLSIRRHTAENNDKFAHLRRSFKKPAVTYTWPRARFHTGYK